MTDIPFTQYLRPNGRRLVVQFAADEELAALANQVLSRGLRFECEVLIDGMVSLTVADPDEDMDVAVEVVANGPGVPAAVDRLVRRAFKLADSK